MDIEKYAVHLQIDTVREREIVTEIMVVLFSNSRSGFSFAWWWRLGTGWGS